jgi:hypothetical protein
MYEEDEDMEEFSDLKMSAPEISQGYAGFIMDGTLTMHFFSRKHKMNRMVQVDISFRTDAHAYMKRTCENKFTLEERQ